MSDLQAATEHYQSLLEGHRGLNPMDDAELYEQVTEDLEHARRQMEIAWLEHGIAR
jgi:hypothetical protein